MANDSNDSNTAAGSMEHIPVESTSVEEAIKAFHALFDDNAAYRLFYGPVDQWDSILDIGFFERRPGDWTPKTKVERWVHRTWWTRYYPNTTKPRYLYFWPSPEDMDKEFPVARADREYNRRCDFEFSIFNKSPAEVPTFESMCAALHLPVLDRHDIVAAQPFFDRCNREYWDFSSLKRQSSGA